MPWLFRTPTVLEGPAGFDRLFGRVQIDRGVSVQELPQGSFRTMRFPTQDQIADAVNFYLGGHEYPVDDATKAALIAAGIGITNGNFTSTLTGFGTGGFGEGGYGGY